VPEITPGKLYDMRFREEMRMRHPEDVQIVIILLRKLRGWTQADLAEASGLSVSAISRYETGDMLPTSEALEEIALAAGLPFPMLDRVFLWIGATRATVASAANPGDLGRLAEAAASQLAVGVADLTYSIAREILADLPELDTGPWARPAAPPQAEDREEVQEIADFLGRFAIPTRRALVEDCRRFQKWALCERLCAESLHAAARSPEEALDLADLALLTARRTRGEETWCQRLQGYALAHLAKARQARGDLSGAREAMAQARQLWEAGAPGDPGLLDESRMLELEAALAGPTIH
jgi:transcriptional regulator with XRE-family HTH domain